MFKGINYHQTDEKGRLRIPAKLKSQLGDKAFITRGGNGSLIVFTNEYFEKNIFEKIRDIEYSDVEAMKIVRQISAFIFDIEEDNQGRFVLPPVLKSYAAINKNVATIGAGNFIEIWSQERFDRIINGESIESELSDTNITFNAILTELDKLLKRREKDAVANG